MLSEKILTCSKYGNAEYFDYLPGGPKMMTYLEDPSVCCKRQKKQVIKIIIIPSSVNKRQQIVGNKPNSTGSLDKLIVSLSLDMLHL